MATWNPGSPASAEIRASLIIFRPAPARMLMPSTSCSRLTTRTTRPSTPASAMSRLVPAPSSKYGTPRMRQPSSTVSMDLGFADSMKNSAGPPMPNEVREASGSPPPAPGTSLSQGRLNFLRHHNAPLFYVPRPHQHKHAARVHQGLL